RMPPRPSWTKRRPFSNAPARPNIARRGQLRRALCPGRGTMQKFLRRNLAGYTFLLPWLIGFFALAVGPIVSSLYLSFTDYDAVAVPNWIGLENYEFMMRDRRFWKALSVTFSFVVISVPAKLVFALA